MEELVVTIRYSKDGQGPVLLSAPYPPSGPQATYHGSGASFSDALAALTEALLTHSDPLPTRLFPRRPSDAAMAVRVADEVRKRRTLSGLTHAQLAEKAGIHESHVQKVETANGVDDEPTLGVLGAVAGALGCQTRDLLRHPADVEAVTVSSQHVARIDRAMATIRAMSPELTRDQAVAYLIDQGLKALGI